MKKLWPLLLAAAAAGCATVPPVANVQVGFTPEQVEAALGKPDRIYRRQTADGTLEAWGYMPWWPGFSVVTEPRASHGTVVSADIPLEPIRRDEDVRVFFKAGKVAAIESRQSR